MTLPHFRRFGRGGRAVFFAVALLALAGAIGCAARPPEPAEVGQSHHVPRDGFRNPEGSPTWQPETFDFLRFIKRRFEADDDPAVILPKDFVVPRANAHAALRASSNPRITWIGHVNFLIGIDGINVMTDPFFSERASPVGFAGPKRLVPPGLEIADLPPIDVILISHNHYDSFDIPSLERLAVKSPKARVLVPIGLGDTVRRAGFENVREMDWYDRDVVGAVTFVSTPAIHRSNRGLFDVNKTLWGGFAIKGSALSIWFAGDTGFGPIFEQEVAPRVGPVDVALVPAGAFLPRSVMRPVHVTPEEGLELARIMGAKTAIAMHWGTLPLGQDLPKDAIERFQSHPTPDMRKIMMRIGETLRLPHPAALTQRVGQ